MTLPTRPVEDEPATLRERVQRLESELDALRRALEPARDLPDSPFEALEVVVGGAPWLVPIGAIREVLPRMALTPIPDAPAWVAGGFSFAGQTVPVVDLADRLYHVSAKAHAHGYVLFVDRPAWVGLLVDGIGRVVRIVPTDLVPPPAGLGVSALLRANATLEGRPTSLLSLDHVTFGEGDHA